jgi:tetratricopeptide (TPR) repeat protein
MVPAEDMMRSHGYFVLALMALAAGCDPSAKPSGNERALNLSNQYESCASSMDCAAGLRCFEQVCRSTDVSLLGDYYAAVGARALSAGEADQAIEAYTAAINRYESDKKPVPVSLRCARGRALLAAGGNTEQAEAAARSLHRCLREAPAGSPLRAQALTHLSQLTDSGLDPELLARESDMTAYLTKKPAAPTTDDLTLTATGDARNAKDSYAKFLERIQGQEARGPLVSCWQANWQATQQKELSVKLPFRYRFEEGEFEENDRDRLTIEGAEPAPGTPERCVYDALSALTEEHTKGKQTGHRWTANITVRIGP